MDSGDSASRESEDMKYAQRIIEEFRGINQGSESPEIQTYLTETFIPNVRGGINRLLKSKTFTLLDPKYFYNPHGNSFIEMIVPSTKNMSGLQEAVTQLLQNPNAAYNGTHEELVVILKNELAAFHKVKNKPVAAEKTNDDTPATIKMTQDETSAAVHETVPKEQAGEAENSKKDTTIQPTAGQALTTAKKEAATGDAKQTPTADTENASKANVHHASAIRLKGQTKHGGGKHKSKSVWSRLNNFGMKKGEHEHDDSFRKQIWNGLRLSLSPIPFMWKHLNLLSKDYWLWAPFFKDGHGKGGHGHGGGHH